PAARRLLGGGAAHAAPRAVAGGAERLLVGALGADQDVGIATHVTRDQDRLSHVAVGRRRQRVPRWEGARRSLAVQTELTLHPVDAMGLDLGDIVADVVNHLDPEIPRPSLKD